MTDGGLPGHKKLDGRERRDLPMFVLRPKPLRASWGVEVHNFSILLKLPGFLDQLHLIIRIEERIDLHQLEVRFAAKCA